MSTYIDPETDFDSLSFRQKAVLHDLNVGVAVRYPNEIDYLLRRKMLVKLPDKTIIIAPAIHHVYKRWEAGGFMSRNRF